MRNVLRKTFLLTIIVSILVIGCGKKDSPAPSEPSTTPAAAVNEQAPLADDELPGQSIPVPVKQENEFNDYVQHVRPAKEIVVECKRLEADAPTIDGIADESVWDEITPIETLDFSCQRPIELRCFHDGQSIYFLVTYPDTAASETHKSWVWDKTEQIYKPCNDREDMFVFKWLMTGEGISFSADKAVPHTADIWFWKACRTNQSGYFDDKSHILTKEERDLTAVVESDKYGKLYLSRPGDAGKSAYEERLFFEYQGDCLYKYYAREPQGSRADIAGKGNWKDGKWTIEIQRKLQTGNDDDVQLEAGKQYVFSACLYEMSASNVEEFWYQPLYKTGNPFDHLILEVK